MTESAPASPGFGLQPAPRLQQLVLPTPWEVGPVQIYVILGDPLTLIDMGVKSPASQMRTRMRMVIGGLDVPKDDGRVEPRRRDDGVVVYAPRRNLS